MEFKQVEFWVLIHNSPIWCMIREASVFLGEQIGRVLEVDEGERGNKDGRFIRLRVVVDINKPLKRFLKVDLSGTGDIRLLLLKYERLPDFCFRCGLLGHGERECSPKSEANMKANRQYGPWLRAASPPKRQGVRGKREGWTSNEKGVETQTLRNRGLLMEPMISPASQVEGSMVMELVNRDSKDPARSEELPVEGLHEGNTKGKGTEQWKAEQGSAGPLGGKSKKNEPAGKEQSDQSEVNAGKGIVKMGGEGNSQLTSSKMDAEMSILVSELKHKSNQPKESPGPSDRIGTGHLSIETNKQARKNLVRMEEDESNKETPKRSLVGPRQQGRESPRK